MELLTDLLKLEYFGSNEKILKAVGNAKVLLKNVKTLEDKLQFAGHTRNSAIVEELKEALRDAQWKALGAATLARKMIEKEGGTAA